MDRKAMRAIRDLHLLIRWRILCGFGLACTLAFGPLLALFRLTWLITYQPVKWEPSLLSVNFVNFSSIALFILLIFWYRHLSRKIADIKSRIHITIRKHM
jgi:hypothetical protein